MPDSDEKKELDGVARSIAALFSDVEVQSAEDSFGPPAEAEPVEASLVPRPEAEPVEASLVPRPEAEPVEASLVPRPEAEPAGDVPVPLEPEAPLPNFLEDPKAPEELGQTSEDLTRQRVPEQSEVDPESESQVDADPDALDSALDRFLATPLAELPRGSQGA